MGVPSVFAFDSHAVPVVAGPEGHPGLWQQTSVRRWSLAILDKRSSRTLMTMTSSKWTSSMAWAEPSRQIT